MSMHFPCMSPNYALMQPFQHNCMQVHEIFFISNYNRTYICIYLMQLTSLSLLFQDKTHCNAPFGQKVDNLRKKGGAYDLLAQNGLEKVRR
jgi:hypothetical protein